MDLLQKDQRMMVQWYIVIVLEIILSIIYTLYPIELSTEHQKANVTDVRLLAVMGFELV